MKERDRETAIGTERKKGGKRDRERARARRRGDGGQRARRRDSYLKIRGAMS